MAIESKKEIIGELHNFNFKYVMTHQEEIQRFKKFVSFFPRDSYELYMNDHGALSFFMKDRRDVYSFNGITKKMLEDTYNEYNIEIGENKFFDKGFVNRYYEKF